MEDIAGLTRISVLVDLVSGLAMMAVGVPLMLKKIPMNRWYGIRIPKAYESEENWYSINYVGGKVFTACGAIVAFVGIATHFAPPGAFWAYSFVWAGALLPMAAMIPVLMYARRL